MKSASHALIGFFMGIGGAESAAPWERLGKPLPKKISMRRLLPLVMLPIPVAGVVLMELFGAVRPLEFMALAGHTQHRNGHQQQEKKFHRRAS